MEPDLNPEPRREQPEWLTSQEINKVTLLFLATTTTVKDQLSFTTFPAVPVWPSHHCATASTQHDLVGCGLQKEVFTPLPCLHIPLFQSEPEHLEVIHSVTKSLQLHWWEKLLLRNPFHLSVMLSFPQGSNWWHHSASLQECRKKAKSSQKLLTWMKLKESQRDQICYHNCLILLLGEKATHQLRF